MTSSPVRWSKCRSGSCSSGREGRLRQYLIPLSLFYSEKYDLVGKLLKPGEDPKRYSEESEDDSEVTSVDENDKDK